MLNGEKMKLRKISTHDHELDQEDRIVSRVSDLGLGGRPVVAQASVSAMRAVCAAGAGCVKPLGLRRSGGDATAALGSRVAFRLAA